jgi:uncharacterized protein (DUF4415 family)
MGNLANRFRQIEPEKAVTAKPAIQPKASSEKRGRGRPHSGNETVTLRLSSAVLAHYRASGDGWQSRLNADLVRMCDL